MKTLLCYGDSNTYGYIPGSGGRYDKNTRWTGVLRSLLNADAPHGEPLWWVVEEGLNGRTICLDDPYEPYRNGLSHIVPILKSHKPIDIVVIMLGTNDTKRRFNPSPYDIAQGLELLIKAALHSESGPGDGAPEVLVIGPPAIEIAEKPFFDDVFDGSIECSKKLGAYFNNIAKMCNVKFLDAAQIVHAGSLDGVHLDKAGHQLLARAVAGKIQQIFG